jgi:hypothetical protein
LPLLRCSNSRLTFCPRSRFFVYFEAVSFGLKLQIDLSFPDGGWQSTEALVTNESLGYIFGFVDGVQQALNVNDMETKIEMLAAVMVTLLGEGVGAAST